MAILVGLSFFFLLVAENMPATSEAVPLVGMYYTVTMIEVSCAFFMTCWVLRFHHHNPTDGEVPRWVKVGLSWLTCSSLSSWIIVIPIYRHRYRCRRFHCHCHCHLNEIVTFIVIVTLIVIIILIVFITDTVLFIVIFMSLSLCLSPIFIVIVAIMCYLYHHYYHHQDCHGTCRQHYHCHQ